MLKRKGFTLIELMIVVAIIGILAMIAIPTFRSMQYDAKRAEVPSNVSAIKKMEEAYQAGEESGNYIAATAYPGSTPGTAQVAWVASSSGGFKTLGWAPDGKVRGVYSVTTSGSAGSTADFTATGLSDVDGNSTLATYTASRTVNTTRHTAKDVY